MPKADKFDVTRTGPETLAGRYLRAHWQPIAHSDALGPGQALPLKVMAQELTLYRGESGQPHLVDGRCPHRGLQLSIGCVEGEEIRCFYHGWKFDCTGQCTEQPAERPAFAHKIRIGGYLVQDYLGLVFGYLGEGEPPPLPRYPDFENVEGLIENESYLRRCNYFQNLENSIDHVHVGFVHRGQPGSFDGVNDSPNIRVEESSWGITCHIERPSGRIGRSQFGMPNVFHLRGLPNDPDIAGHREFLAWWVPIDDESHMQFGVYAVRLAPDKIDTYRTRQARRRQKQQQPHAELAERILSGQLRLENVDPDTTDMVRLVDDLAQVGQGRIVDRSHDHLGRSDAGVIMIRKLWRREMTAFAKGEDLTPWTYDPETLSVAKS